MTTVQWRKKNPLRVYLNSRDDCSAAKAAEAIGCSRPMVYLWMYGTCSPTMQSMRAITNFSGITYDQWNEWVLQKPREKQCSQN